MRRASRATSAFGSPGGRERHDAGERLAQQVGQHEEGLADADVGGHDGAAPGVDVEKRRLAAAVGLAGGALDDELALQQVVDDEGDGAAGDAHDAGEVGAGDGLVRAHQVQGDAVVDVAAGAARGDLESGRVDAAHKSNV